MFLTKKVAARAPAVAISRFNTQNVWTTTNQRQFSLWSHVSIAQVDPTIGPREFFMKDLHPQKVLLGQGTYRCNEGNPYTLDCVRDAKIMMMAENLDHEYAGIDGIQSYKQRCIELAYGATSEPIKSNRVVAAQCISGTGSLRLGMEFLKDWHPNRQAKVYCPSPTWPFHKPISENSGFECRNYRYYDNFMKGFDLQGMLEDLDRADPEQIVILHACAHNPSGCDPSHEDWLQILEVMKRKGHYAAFDLAYQGFASGDIDNDAYSLRLFAKETDRMFLAQSFSKNFGMYGERAGCLSIVTDSEQEAEKVLTRVKSVAMPMYSNPPIYGARIVDKVLSDDVLTASWKRDLIKMSSRIRDMREQLVDNLNALGSQHDWSHITNQIGMFAYTGFNESQVIELARMHHIYTTTDGRISIAGLNTSNIIYVAEAFHAVSKDHDML